MSRDNTNLLSSTLHSNQIEDVKNLGVGASLGIFGRIVDDVVNIRGTTEYVSQQVKRHGTAQGRTEAALERQRKLLDRETKKNRQREILSQMEREIEQIKELRRTLHAGNRKQPIVGYEGVFHGGISRVPKETSYLLDEGERVLSPKQNEDLTSYLENVRDLRARGVDEERPLKIIGLRSETGFFGEITEADTRRAHEEKKQKEEELKETRRFRQNVLTHIRKVRSDLVSSIVSNMRLFWIRFNRHPVFTTLMVASKGMWKALAPMRAVLLDPMMGFIRRTTEHLFGRKAKTDTDRIVHSNDRITQAIRGNDMLSDKGALAIGLRRLMTADLFGRRKSHVQQAQDFEDRLALGELTPSMIKANKELQKQQKIWIANQEYITRRVKGSEFAADNKNRMFTTKSRKPVTLNGEVVDSNAPYPPLGRDGRINLGRARTSPELTVLRRIHHLGIDDNKHIRSIDRSTSTLATIARMQMAGNILGRLPRFGLPDFGRRGGRRGGLGSRLRARARLGRRNVRNRLTGLRMGARTRLDTAGRFLAQRGASFGRFALSRAPIIGQLAGAGMAGWQVGKFIEPFVRKLGDKILAPFGTDFTSVVGGSIAAVVDPIKDAGSWVKDKITGFFGKEEVDETTEEVKGKFHQLFDDTMQKVRGLMEMLDPRNLWNKGKEKAGALWESVKERSGGFVDSARSTFDSFWNKGVNVVDQASPKVAEVIDKTAQTAARVNDRLIADSKEMYEATVEQTRLLREIAAKETRFQINNIQRSVSDLLSPSAASVIGE